MKKTLLFLGASCAWLCGCASLTGPNLAGELSREEAIRLYNGEIAESAWLEKLDTVSRNLPIADTCSVQLADGFLFYETQLREGERIVVNVIPPADAPEALKELAKSFRRSAPPPKRLSVCGNATALDGKPVSETELRTMLDATKTLPPRERPSWEILVAPQVRAAELAEYISMFEQKGIKPEIIYLQPEDETAKPR